MPIQVIPHFFRLDDGSFLGTLHIVRMAFSNDTAILTITTPDATGSREITVRNPERVAALQKYFVAPPPTEAQT
jgi:hypothetical protein